MKKHSCGAILYTIHNNNIYIILGMEDGKWFPFKGVREYGETNMQAAIREINEETCRAVTIKNINLNCNFSTRNKHYHIGLSEITLSEFNQFAHNRRNLLKINNDKKYKNYNCLLEKDDIKMFHIDDIKNYSFHNITDIPIKFYYDHLLNLQNHIQKNNMD